MEITGKIALVTGSTQGIGKAIARALLQAGTKVVINSRNQLHIQGVVEEFKSISENVIGIAGDVSKNTDVQNIMKQIHQKWGPVDILINNAGKAKFSPILETSEDDWDEMQTVNLKSAFLCSKAVLPDMIEKNSGHIVTITSVAAKKAFQNCAAYSAGKAGVLAFMNVLRDEVRQFGIHATSILAGATHTPLWHSIAGSFPEEKMMSAQSVGTAVLTAIQNPDGMVEEIQIRPVAGDFIG